MMGKLFRSSMVVGLVGLPLLVGVATPASAEYSDYCSDNQLPDGPLNFETGKLGVSLAGFSANYGVQGISDAGKPYLNTFVDNCIAVTTPAINIPFAGQLGGKVVGEYLSTRVQAAQLGCPIEIYILSDGNAFLSHGRYHNCNP